MQAADHGAEVVARTVIGGRRCRDEEPSLEMKSVVTAARLNTEQVNTFSPTQLLILSDDLAHEAISVKSHLLNLVYPPPRILVNSVISRFTHFASSTRWSPSEASDELFFHAFSCTKPCRPQRQKAVMSGFTHLPALSTASFGPPPCSESKPASGCILEESSPQPKA